MDSDDDFMYDEDELSDPEDDQDDFDISCDVEAARDTSSSSFRDKGDDFNYVCLTPESIVVTMNKCIEEVNSVFQVCILKCLWQSKTGIFTAETIAQC